MPFVRGGRAPVEAVQRNRLGGREGSSEGGVDGLVEAERHPAGVGLLELIVAQGRASLVEAFLAVARRGIPRSSGPVEQGLRGAVQHGCPVPADRSAPAGISQPRSRQASYIMRCAPHAASPDVARSRGMDSYPTNLDRIVRIVKVFGMVDVATSFNQTPAVIDGCSDLLVDVFGDAGRHTRSAVGLAELPFDIAVEIELIARLRSG